MTPKCIKEINKLNENNEQFQELTAEQLIYAAIKGTSQQEVKFILENTEWDKWLN